MTPERAPALIRVNGGGESGCDGAAVYLGTNGWKMAFFGDEFFMNVAMLTEVFLLAVYEACRLKLTSPF